MKKPSFLMCLVCFVVLLTLSFFVMKRQEDDRQYVKQLKAEVKVLEDRVKVCELNRWTEKVHREAEQERLQEGLKKLNQLVGLFGGQR